MVGTSILGSWNSHWTVGFIFGGSSQWSIFAYEAHQPEKVRGAPPSTGVLVIKNGLLTTIFNHSLSIAEASWNGDTKIGTYLYEVIQLTSWDCLKN